MTNAIEMASGTFQVGDDMNNLKWTFYATIKFGENPDLKLESGLEFDTEKEAYDKCGEFTTRFPMAIAHGKETMLEFLDKYEMSKAPEENDQPSVAESRSMRKKGMN